MCTFSCQLTQLAEKLGATSITQNKLLMHDNTALRTALIDWINREEEFDEEEGEEDTDMVLIQDWLRKQADTWPVHAGTPPVEGHEADDAHWWAKTRGYEIKLCPDATKGRGVFATRRQRKGSVVGVYWGEYLTRRQFVARLAPGCRSSQQKPSVLRLRRGALDWTRSLLSGADPWEGRKRRFLCAPAAT